GLRRRRRSGPGALDQRPELGLDLASERTSLGLLVQQEGDRLAGAEQRPENLAVRGAREEFQEVLGQVRDGGERGKAHHPRFPLERVQLASDLGQRLLAPSAFEGGEDGEDSLRAVPGDLPELDQELLTDPLGVHGPQLTRKRFAREERRSASLASSAAALAACAAPCWACRVAASSSVMDCTTCSVAERCCCVARWITRAASRVSSVPARIACTLCMACSAGSPPSLAEARLRSVARAVSSVASRISPMRFLISWVEARTFSARRRISAATMEKPRPASPALAPSSAALIASRSERSAISSITSTTEPIRSTLRESRSIASWIASASWLMVAMAWKRERSAASPARAATTVCSATAATVRALSAMLPAALLSSAMVAAASCTALAWWVLEDSLWVAG